MATLFVVATPIGNLEDITLRAISALSNVDIILAEDTRVTKHLLERYHVTTPTISYHQHSTLQKIDRIIDILREGKDVALVSDAGTPGINDPGNFLVKKILQALPDTKVVPLPGSNAAITALSISGFPTDQFTYLGFPPHKKGRQTFFRELAAIEHTVVLYESKHRISKCLGELKAMLGKQQRPIMIGRELTKQFETIYRGTIDEVMQQVAQREPLGEFVIVVGPEEKQKHIDED